ncbi:hypothetical protein SIRV1gp14 [Sulfolobus islandicus rod-shaped virus 1]|uniref:Uncharacterized protein 59 n=1 Tax=Sulfolobus islandicus rod-shaped virus 1 TaxID=157898 RepID=Y59_SIRV1|nr:hypothetical protein SIRV1gp14 [Sulfolobus islandicus rod-shaped virus 1]Q8QL40.1 RecName: Full=Uncharacterized protein 59 [Sulfolobus islandicus rod-shaped virus 1]CAC93969.1 hypothetical protein [Sulfolobus islandicus rod-shaped virus 1]
MMKIITFKIPEETLLLLDAYAIKHNMNRSEVIRLAIEKLVVDEMKNEPVPRARVEKIKF